MAEGEGRKRRSRRSDGSSARNATAGRKRSSRSDQRSGKLRIGDQWNAIRIIALSQGNPLKAIAEFVENSIDAEARHVTIVRGKERGNQFLKVVDDGNGIDDLHYVATHIGDSIKRRLKAEGMSNIQGEFGIGLLSFWTIGEELTLTSAGSDDQPQRLRMVKESPAYEIRPSRELFKQRGTTVKVAPLLPGIRMLGGEKIQAYLASELRDRITKSGVEIRIVDRTARKELTVEPRRFAGALMHGLPECRTPFGEVYTELYLCDPSTTSGLSLYRGGTRVISDLTELDMFRRHPWTSGYVEGIIDAPFVQLTPGTRSGVIHDEGLEALFHALRPLEESLSTRVEEQRRAEEEAASKSMLKRITRALRDAISMLPAEDYGWLNARTSGGKGAGGRREGGGKAGSGTEAPEEVSALGTAVQRTEEGRPGEAESGEGEQRAFFEFPGPLYRVEIRPASATVRVGSRRQLHAIPRDRSRRTIDTDVETAWSIKQGAGRLEPPRGEFTEYVAPDEPELAVVQAVARQDDVECSGEALVTVTAELLPARSGGTAAGSSGLPGYTYRYAPGELWRSSYDVERGIITVNSAHQDFVFASRQNATKLRYVARLFAKEIVLANFPGASSEELLERMVELNLYMESHLR